MRNAWLLLIGVVGVYGMAYVKKNVDVTLKYFKPSEFGQWWPMMSTDLLLKLDQFRDEIGRPIQISPAPGAVGRIGTGNSRHNVTRWGEVQAVDVMFPGATMDDIKGYYEIARQIFGGVGVYPDWKPEPGMHVDVRPGHATWSGALVNGKQEYFTIERAWA